jgi:hypothetical protein
VQIGEQTAGWAVVRKGITETDRVIIDGLQRSRPDMPVDPTIHSASPQDLPAAFQMNAAQLPSATSESGKKDNEESR